jgi:hypothetical protein
VRAFLADDDGLEQVTFVSFDDESHGIYQRVLAADR